jgi:predicted permease
MNKIAQFNPLRAAALVAAPFVLYSIDRTGGDFAHLVDVRLLSSIYAVPICFLVGMFVTSCALHQTGKSRQSLILFVFATSAFLGGQLFTEYPYDYKLWIYIVTPSFVWAFLFALPVVLLMRRLGEGGRTEPGATPDVGPTE